MRTSADNSQPEGANMESCCSASSAHGTARTEAQRLGLLASLGTSNFKRFQGMGTLSGASSSPAPKMRTSTHSSQPEAASLESCCFAISAHGTARTEARTLMMLAYLATLNFKYTPGMEGCCRSRFAAVLRKCKRLLIARSQKWLSWKAVAQPRLPMAMLAQRHREWGCLLVLPPQTSNVARGMGSLTTSSSRPDPKMRTSPYISQPEGASLESCCSASSSHGAAHTEAQRLGLLACLTTSKFKRVQGMGVPAGLLSQPCSENANVSK